MKNSHKLFFLLAFIPYLGGMGYYQMADFAKNKATMELEKVHSPKLGFENGTLGEIRMFAGNFAPRGWALCNGSILPISQNSALFSILGTTYGGDGRTSFGLPDLRGRTVIGVGTSPGLSKIDLGQRKGREIFNLQKTRIKSATDGELVTVTTDSKFRTHQPSLGINYIICVSGTYPSRN
ncbi:MAG: tail fiber protein [Bacteroidia bacterium]|nr:tail fiber protein [Bacteroidia bacterium]